ncbi:hypothetical protein [Devosia crocina]|uniref:hypothetical protein n=1 Tax=Devosia crocina TaxID=429728 RepID=UPI000B810B57|nr:hypothetical protein [Devosia crocina]
MKQSDLTSILKGAAAAGFQMPIIVTAGEVRFIPVNATPKIKPLSELEIWKAKRDARRRKEQQ